MPDGMNGSLSLCHPALSATPDNLALRQIGSHRHGGAGTHLRAPARGSFFARDPEHFGE